MMQSQIRQSDTVREFAVAVGDSLRKVGQRELPSMYLYDELGTALFDAITLLPDESVSIEAAADARATLEELGVGPLLTRLTMAEHTEPAEAQ